MRLAVGFALLYLAALNSVTSLVTGTCTGGSADEMMTEYISLILYPAGFAFIYYGRASRLALLAIAPVILVMLFEISFNVRLFYGYVFLGKSVCEIKHGYEQLFDGREPLFILLLSAINMLSVGGAVLVVREGLIRRDARQA